MLSYTLFAAKCHKHVLFTMTEAILHMGSGNFTLKASDLNKYDWHLLGMTTRHFQETSEDIKVKSQVWVNLFERVLQIFTFLLVKVVIGFSLSFGAFRETVEGKKVTFLVYVVKVECPVREQVEKTKKSKDIRSFRSFVKPIVHPKMISCHFRTGWLSLFPQKIIWRMFLSSHWGSKQLTSTVWTRHSKYLNMRVSNW